MNPPDKFFVYRNLNKKCWSLRAMNGLRKGLIVRHTDFFVMENCVFKVSVAGRNRVLKECRKNVHDGVLGNVHDGVLGFESFDIWCGYTKRVEVTYNPYVYCNFVVKETQEPVTSAKHVWFFPNGRVYAVLDAVNGDCHV